MPNSGKASSHTQDAASALLGSRGVRIEERRALPQTTSLMLASPCYPRLPPPVEQQKRKEETVIGGEETEIGSVAC